MRMVLTNSYGSSGGSGLPLQENYTSGAGLTTAPAGAVNVIIAAWGGGAGGRPGYFDSEPFDGQGGGSGGYSQTSIAITAGQTLNYSVGGAGSASNSGGNTSVSSGTKTITTMNANGAPNGSGGTASGGTSTNTTGNTGSDPPGGAAIVGWNSNSGGRGGDGGFGVGAQMVGDPGQSGKVIFYYT